MTLQPVVSADDWEAARQALLVDEKAVMKARDALAAKRRRMPWLTVEKTYRFEGPHGSLTLADLFDGRRQLIVYRAFYEPAVTTFPTTGSGWAYPERGCTGCSFVADQVAHPAHLNARNTSLVFVSRAPQAEIQALQQRMGWESIPWYSITDDFDLDFGVDQMHGTNAFIRDGGRIFRTYFVTDRGDEQMGNTWNYLDITALGRQEEWEDSPAGYPQTPPYVWWSYHDAYDTPHSRRRDRGAPSTEIHGTSRIVIHPGKLDDFKRLAGQCVDIVESRDDGTVEYELFLDEQRMECFVHERYRDSAAGLRHMSNIEPMMPAMSEICTITGEVCGAPVPELREALEQAGVMIYTPFLATRSKLS